MLMISWDKWILCTILLHHILPQQAHCGQDYPMDNMTEIFHRFELVPAVVSVAPTEFVNIFYEKMNCTVEPTDNAFRDEVETAPKVWWNCNESVYYTLNLVDINNHGESERPRFHLNATWWRERQWHVWLVVNIPGCDIYRGDVLFEYSLGMEKNEADMHILVFLVYRQPSSEQIKFYIPTRDKYDDRSGFEIEKFANHSHFGPPIAGNFLYFA